MVKNQTEYGTGEEYCADADACDIGGRFDCLGRGFARHVNPTSLNQNDGAQALPLLVLHPPLSNQSPQSSTARYCHDDYPDVHICDNTMPKE